jgi:integrase
VAELAALVEAMPEPLRFVVVLAAWCQLRRAEIVGLRRKDVDPLQETVAVAETRTRMMSGKLLTKEPKSESSRRVVAVPPFFLDALLQHPKEHVGVDAAAHVISVTPKELAEAWWTARASIGRNGLRLHDLRHTGQRPPSAASTRRGTGTRCSPMVSQRWLRQLPSSPLQG